MDRLAWSVVPVALLLIGAVAAAPSVLDLELSGPSEGAPAAGPGDGPEGPPEDPGRPDCGPSVVAENDDVRLWFHGTKAFVKVFVKDGDGAGLEGMYQTTSEAIVELDGGGDAVAVLNLERAYPQHSTCEVEEDANFVNVTYTVTDAAVRAPEGGDGDGALLGDANATFAYRFNKSSDGAKFDVVVEDWPWQTDDGELAFDLDVDAGGFTIEPAENGLGFRDGEGDEEGFITWAMNATATYEDDHEEEAIVDSNVTVSGSHADVRLRYTNVSAGYVHLLHDPWVGTGPYVIVGPLLVPVAQLDDLVPLPLSLL